MISELLELPDGRRRPRPEAGEKQMLEGFLDFQRETAITKVSGVPEARLRETMTPTGLNMLGLVKHLAHAERFWFHYVFAGEDAPIATTQAEWDDLFTAHADETLDVLVKRYRGDIERSKQLVAGSPVDAHAARRNGSEFTLRWILLHMIEELARHNGHLDIFRERVDGAIGE